MGSMKGVESWTVMVGFYATQEAFKLYTKGLKSNWVEWSQATLQLTHGNLTM